MNTIGLKETNELLKSACFPIELTSTEGGEANSHCLEHVECDVYNRLRLHCRFVQSGEVYIYTEQTPRSQEFFMFVPDPLHEGGCVISGPWRVTHGLNISALQYGTE